MLEVVLPQVTIHRVMDTEHGRGNMTREIMLSTLVNQWVKFYDKPDIVRTDPDGAFRDQDVVWLPGVYALTLIL